MFFNWYNSLIIYCFNALKRTRGPAGERAGHGSTISISIDYLFYFIYSLFVLLSVRSLCLCAVALPSVCLCAGCVVLHNRLAAPTNRIIKRSLFLFLFWNKLKKSNHFFQQLLFLSCCIDKAYYLYCFVSDAYFLYKSCSITSTTVSSV